jgi:hypothetical protein
MLFEQLQHIHGKQQIPDHLRPVHTQQSLKIVDKKLMLRELQVEVVPTSNPLMILLIR